MPSTVVRWVPTVRLPTGAPPNQGRRQPVESLLAPLVSEEGHFTIAAGQLLIGTGYAHRSFFSVHSVHSGEQHPPRSGP